MRYFKSKGPTPPARLPTEEEKTRGPRMSDHVNDFSHYLTPEEVKVYKHTKRLPRRGKPSRTNRLVWIGMGLE